jgi:predicted RNA-binding Zn-ribbon protein involved in translation (DUF1610 family)
MNGAQSTTKTWCPWCKRYYLDDVTVVQYKCPYCGKPAT